MVSSLIQQIGPPPYRPTGRQKFPHYLLYEIQVYHKAVYRGVPRADKWQKGACMTREYRHDLYTIPK